ncbi:hypothetical protein [Coleofasciculus sp. FACHB-SPT9]|uniref:hypothetical protein n=1 Tax=Cyanophyceae TaxID=3028117 RepID=UPI001686D331|nr:hypothetical protein [Coleofasciculus sp. FACHB-SPT9]MBD1890975.1 hypothetical protein [Coleofasciculus sp. FACHB-SPT9]
MVQQPIQQERPPLYSCVIAIDSVTGRQEEEIIAFGVSVDDAKKQAQQLLANYGCDESQILKLIQQARTEPVSPWCSPENRQG